jgi:predicted small secreted protein
MELDNKNKSTEKTETLAGNKSDEHAGIGHKLGDAIERLGHKISDAGAKGIGEAISNLGNKIEHAGEGKDSDGKESRIVHDGNFDLGL